MKQKLLSILVLLSLCVTGAWAIKSQTIKTATANKYSYSNANFQIAQRDGYNRIANNNGINAHTGIVISKLNEERWITSIEIVSTYSNGLPYITEDYIHVSSGTVTFTRENRKTTVTITGIKNDEDFVLTCDYTTPQFSSFKFYYYNNIPVELNTRAQLENIAATYGGQEEVDVYHSRDFKKNVAATLFLPFHIDTYTSGSLYQLTDVTYDEEEGEWVATMSDVSDGNLVDVEDTQAGYPYLFMPAEDGKVFFYGTIGNPVFSSLAVDDYNKDSGIGLPYEVVWSNDEMWRMAGTYDRVNFADIEEETMAFYGFVSAFNTDESTGEGTEIDFTNETVEAGQFVRAAGAAYFPIFRAYLALNNLPSARGEARQPISAPDRVIVRLVNKNGSVTKLNAVKTVVNDNVWYGLQGRRYSSKPAKAGVYMNNGKKLIVK